MKREIKFVSQMHEDFGEVGLKPKGCGPAFEPLMGGFGLAHDCIEHIDGLEDIQDEIVAHGVMYWLRYESGWIGRHKYAKNLTLDAIASEWINLYQGIEWSEGYLAAAPDEPEHDEDREEDIQTILDAGVRACHDEHGEDVQEDTVNHLAANFVGWFRRGIRLAEEQYGPIGRDEVLEWFSSLLERFEEIVNPDLQEEIEFTVTLDTEERTATLKTGGRCGVCECVVEEFDLDYPLCEDCQEGY